MLTGVRLQNFRCFRDATVRLGPLTAVVGPNASGKTAFLQAISAPRFGGRGLGPRDIWQHGDDAQIQCTCTTPGVVQVHLRHGFSSSWHHRGLYLHLDAMKIREHQVAAEAGQLNEDGSNLTNVFATFPRRTQENVSRQLADLVSVLGDVDVRPSQGGKQRLVFQDRWKPQIWYEPDEVSDGTLLTLGILVTQHSIGGPFELVAIEEPEHGLHPYLLREVVSGLRKLAAGGGVQIVMATHSAELLEFLAPEEVRFLTRSAEDGSVIVEEAPTGTDDWRRTYQVYQESLGSLWLSGNVGGVPGGR